MKILIAILFLFFLKIGYTLGQSNDMTIINVETKCSIIKDSLNTYDTVKSDIWGESTEGGEVIAYFRNDVLKFITVCYYGETGKREIDYCFHNGHLCYIVDITYSYNRPFYWDENFAKENNDTTVFNPEKTKIVEYDTYYFENRQLIQWIQKEGNSVNYKSDVFKNRQKEILMRIDELKEKLR